MAKIYLIEGPVGAGKSTFAARLSATHSAPRLNLDEWMVTLFRPDRPDTGSMAWYGERTHRCIEQIWAVACDIIDTGNNVVLELGLVQAGDRLDFYSRVDSMDYDLEVYVLDAPKEIRRQRVMQRNQEQGATFRMAVSDEIFEIADRAWQPPDDQECAERSIQLISTDD